MIVKVLPIVIALFALVTVEVKQLKLAIIYLGIFSLINAVAYIFYGAPDVSLAEAVIGSTLATIMYLIAIKKHNLIKAGHIREENKFSLSDLFGKKYRVLLGGFCAIICILILSTYLNFIEVTGTPAWDYYVRFFKQDTGASNAVTAIYLNYRVYDTLFEALLLLVSVIAIIYFSWRADEWLRTAKSDERIDTTSEIVSTVTGFLYPFILLYGFYLAINGHLTPGGGFQGGAVLAAVFMLRYLSTPSLDMDIVVLQTLEKIFFICIVLVAIFFILNQQGFNSAFFSSLYFVFMNVLIGFKVCCGISIIFFRFMYHLGR